MGQASRWQVRCLVAAALAAGVALSGCTLGTPTLAEENVEKSVADELAAIGRAADQVDCPGDLLGKVGTSMRCTLTSEGDTYGLTVRVNKVEGTTVKFDIVVDELPRGS